MFEMQFWCNRPSVKPPKAKANMKANLLLTVLVTHQQNTFYLWDVTANETSQQIERLYLVRDSRLILFYLPNFVLPSLSELAFQPWLILWRGFFLSNLKMIFSSSLALRDLTMDSGNTSRLNWISERVAHPPTGRVAHAWTLDVDGSNIYHANEVEKSPNQSLKSTIIDFLV